MASESVMPLLNMCARFSQGFLFDHTLKYHGALPKIPADHVGKRKVSVVSSFVGWTRGWCHVSVNAN